jgi:pilus assembly protein Flp/PilA
LTYTFGSERRVAFNISPAAIHPPPYSQIARENVAMRKLGQFVVDFLKAEDGPTAVEYAVMLALIVVVCIGAITTLGTNANTTFTSVGNVVGSSS